MKKRYIFLLLFLLLVPLTGIKAITWGMIKNLDTAWSGYGCYFLYNGDNQDYNYSFTPTYTSQSHTTSNDVRCHSGGFENGETGLYPLTNMYGCNLTPAQFKSARSTDSDNINGVYNGGGYNISYNNWSSSGASIADCIAGVIIGNSDLSQRRTEIEENILVEAQKNSDFLSSEEMEKMKAYYSDFNDDTQFCFVRGHQGDEYATYFGHIYADITFQDYLFHDSSTKDTDKRELITFPSDAPSDDAFSITVFPDITQTIEILDLKEYNGQMTDNHSVIVLNKGKLITDASICNKEVIDAFIQDDEEAIDSLDDEVLKDVIDGKKEDLIIVQGDAIYTLTTSDNQKNNEQKNV